MPNVITIKTQVLLERWLSFSCMTSRTRRDFYSVFISSLSFSCRGGKRIGLHQSNGRFSLSSVDYLEVWWFCSSLNVPIFPASSVAAVLATTWFVEDEISPLCTMACSGLLSVGPLCWVSLLWLISGAVLMLSLSPPSLPPSPSLCSCSVRFSLLLLLLLSVKRRFFQ